MRVEELRDLLAQHLRRHRDHVLFKAERDDPMHCGKHVAPSRRSARALFLPRPNDGRASVASAKLAGMADHIIVKASHTGLPRHDAAIEQTIAFLDDGRFAPVT